MRAADEDVPLLYAEEPLPAALRRAPQPAPEKATKTQKMRSRTGCQRHVVDTNVLARLPHSCAGQAARRPGDQAAR